MKKIISLILTAVLTLSLVFAFAGCNKEAEGVTIAIPNDTTNEALSLIHI